MDGLAKDMDAKKWMGKMITRNVHTPVNQL